MTAPEAHPTEAILFKAVLTGQMTAAPLWTADELGDVLAHQLAAPLEDDLGELGADVASALRARPASGPPLATFADLLRHPGPPRLLLDGLKRFGKLHRRDDSAAIGPSIATLLYYAAVLLARVRLGERITALADAQIAEGVRWATAQPWVDAETRAILDEGLRRLGV